MKHQLLPEKKIDVGLQHSLVFIVRNWQQQGACSHLTAVELMKNHVDEKQCMSDTASSDLEVQWQRLQLNVSVISSDKDGCTWMFAWCLHSQSASWEIRYVWSLDSNDECFEHIYSCILRFGASGYIWFQTRWSGYAKIQVMQDIQMIDCQVYRIAEQQ